MLAAVACIVFVGVFVWYGAPLWIDIRAGAVSQIEGIVQTGEREIDIKPGSMPAFPV